MVTTKKYFYATYIDDNKTKFTLASESVSGLFKKITDTDLLDINSVTLWTDYVQECDGDGDLCDLEGCKFCCNHDELDHGICLDCAQEGV